MDKNEYSIADCREAITQKRINEKLLTAGLHYSGTKNQEQESSRERREWDLVTHIQQEPRIRNSNAENVLLISNAFADLSECEIWNNESQIC